MCFLLICQISLYVYLVAVPQYLTRMWANAQRDGHPAEYTWRPLFNAAVWLMPNTGVLCSNAAKTGNRSSPYYKDMWKRYCCLTSSFSDCRYMP